MACISVPDESTGWLGARHEICVDSKILLLLRSEGRGSGDALSCACEPKALLLTLLVGMPAWSYRMDELSRRVLLRRILHVTVSLAMAPAALSTAAAAESCVDPSSESLRTSLHYANPSSNSSETCSGCGFFGGDAATAACGNCQIMGGPVDAGGRCDSWAAKS